MTNSGPSPKSRKREIFLQALEKTSEQDRAVYLDQACGDNLNLRSAIDVLLAHHFKDAFLEQPAIDQCAEHEIVGGILQKTGDRIGRYKLLEQIGEGGFGIVFMAEQKEPVRRKVALKIIKAGMDTIQVIARFEAERQALAMMEHPNIAKVLDAGTTEQGRPYFVMELVQGIPIAKFCDQNRLSIQERLNLFISVCHAIQHAHQKGIIHRDIKPSNVLVTKSHGNPHPIVIDFGVAKAINQRLTERTLFTNFAQMIGTPAYMSPEQAEMSKDDVDTRSDIYSLGIMLYELLTGTTPFPEERFKEVGYAKWQQIIREEEPVRPSTTLSRMNGKSRGIARNRNCEPATLRNLIHGDLDWIILKAIDKDRDRRYATALELVADLQRHLANEPVSARPPSAGYALRKLVGRNRRSVLAGAAFLVALLGGTSVALWQSIRATRSEQQVLAERGGLAATLDFVKDEMLTPANPYLSGPNNPPDRNRKLLDVIQRAAVGLEDRFADQPLVLADIHQMIGNTFRGMGELPSAEKHLQSGWRIFQRELGAEDLKTLHNAKDLAWVLLELRSYEKAANLCEEILRGCEHRLDPAHGLILQTRLCLGRTMMRRGRYGLAEELLRELLERAQQTSSPNAELIAGARFALSGTLFYAGRIKEAEALTRQNLEASRHDLGPDHPTTLGLAVEVVRHLRQSQSYHEADQLAQDTLERCQRALGESASRTIFLRSQMAALARGRGLSYVPRQRQAYELALRELGENDRITLFLKMELGRGLGEDGDFEEGARLLREAMETLQHEIGPEDSFSRWSVWWLAEVYEAQQQFNEAEPLWLQALQTAEQFLANDSGRVLRQLRGLGNLYARQSKWPQATAYFDRIVSVSSSDYKDHVAGLLTFCLAGNRQATEKVIASALERFGDTTSEKEAYQIGRALWLAYDWVPVANHHALVTLAQLGANRSNHPVENKLLESLVACRVVEGKAVLEGLESLSEDPNVMIASLAGFLWAEALHQQGRFEAAQAALLETNARLERALRLGDLSRSGMNPGGDWLEFAAVILARNLAERRLQPTPALSAMDKSFLSDSRATWKPVKERLELANRAARQWDWPQARKLFMEAMKHPQFDWDAAMVQDPDLGEKLALLHGLTGHWDSHVELASRLIHQTPFGPSGNPKAFLYHPRLAESELRNDILLLARRRWGGESENRSEEERQENHLKMGLIDFRIGNYPEAQAALRDAMEAYRLTVSGPAHAYAAVVSWMTGHRTEGKQLFSKSERLFQEFQNGNPNDLGSQWVQAAFFEFALREARDLLTDDILQQQP